VGLTTLIFFSWGDLMVEFKFLCPKCGKLLDEFGDYWMEKTIYYVRPRNDGSVECFNTDTISDKRIETFCPECDSSFEYEPEDFLVMITDDDDIIPYGFYWIKHKDDFVKIKAKIIMS